MKTRNSYKYYYLRGWQLEIIRDFHNLKFDLMGKRRNIMKMLFQSIGLPTLLTQGDLSRHTHTNSATVPPISIKMYKMIMVHKNIEQLEVYIWTEI